MNITQHIGNWLNSEGVFNEWIDDDGATQDAFTFQRDWLDETRSADTDRIIYVGQEGSSGDRYTQSVTITISFIGDTDGNDRNLTKQYAERIYELMLTFPTNDDCIVSIDPLTYINGAYKMESGRCAYDFELQVSYQTGQIDN